MTRDQSGAPDDRVLLLAPTRKDGATTVALLRGAGMPVVSCAALDELIAELRLGAAMAIVPEEAMTPPGIGALAALLQQQPPWSDMPILVLASAGADSAVTSDAMRRLGNVTILERPLRVPTLLSAVRTALRARRRQYEIREHHAQLEDRVRQRTSEVRGLFERLVSAQEEERRRIARDIHDHVGQQMTALRMSLEALRAQAAGHGTLVEQAERVQRLAEELDQAIDFLTWQLRPAVLDHLGLPAALQTLVEGWSERFSTAADFTADEAADVRLPRDVEANLYRIAQEALHNVAKHAHATHVTLSLAQQDGNLVLRIDDNGRGFDRDREVPAAGSGMGLINMRERAALAGGRLELASAEGRGTSISVRIPDRKTAEAR